MSSLGSRIRELRKLNRLTQKEIADKLGMGSSNFGHIENDRVTPSSKDLEIIASILNTSTDYLLGRTSTQGRTCPECGMSYELPYEEKEHNQYHSKYLQALNKYGFFFSREKREKMKRESYNVLEDKSSTLSEQIKATETVFKSYFSRSLEKLSFDICHPEFNEYVSMLLNQKDWKTYLPQNVYKELVNKYGIKPGMVDGQTYYERTQEAQASSQITTLAAHKVDGYDDDLTEEEQAAVRAFIEAYRKQFKKE